jgi:hypothetical protein
MELLRAQNIALTGEQTNTTRGMTFRDVHSIQEQDIRLQFVY